MMPRIFGNHAALHLIRTMVQSGHVPHACLLHGEKGLGKKTLARYFAMSALCTGAVQPCMECSSCRKAVQDVHPDILWVEHSGKKQGFSVETVRSICRDAIVAPNDGERKVYIFADCDSMDIRSQNTLLKLTEEPPPHVLLLFTAEHRNVFLETMLSRMVPLAVCPCTPEDCRQALLEAGRTQAEAEQAVSICGGNIGKCLEWLDSAEMQAMTKHAGELTAAIAAKRSYDILRILAVYEKDGKAAAEFVRLLDLQLRDALVLKYTQDNLTGCDRQSAQALSQVLSVNRSAQLHRAVQETYDALQANVSPRLALAALGGQLC
ncbi:MAG: hypothetical protein IJY06_06685 [Oscillospiraceae bacterium]|nr:hypothetical protein [Oscillospiraceae bacterium]